MEQKAKDVFDIREIGKADAFLFVSKYHYLGSKDFLSMFQYGLFIKGTEILVGVSTFSTPAGVNTLNGWFGLKSNNTIEIQELTRLCVIPELNGSNATSFLLSNSMKMIRKLGVKAVITLADATRHVGSIYQNCHFKYYGLTEQKTDMYSTEGTNIWRNVRDKHGVWLPRNRKHRYAYVFDYSLHVNYQERPYPNREQIMEKPECCQGKLVVHDRRHDEWFTCPRCTSSIVRLTKEEADEIEKGHSGDLDFVEELIARKSSEGLLF